MRWTPHVTVAAVIEKNKRFLLVEELVDNQHQFNQPAGHWEPNETLSEAIIREVLEETAFDFRPTALVGIYHWLHQSSDTTFLRFAFTGELGEQQQRELDEGIIAARWLTYDEIQQCLSQHRSPQVMRCIDDYLSGQRLPLNYLIKV